MPIKRSLRIGIFGLRGLDPDLEISGFETAFGEIAPRLAALGHEVTIFCRAGAHSPGRRVPRDRGIELLYLPSPGGKNLSAIVSTLLAVLRALATRRRFDVWFFVNVGMGYHCALARLSGRPVVLNVDGLDWTRGKWGPIGRAYFYSAARTAVRACTALVTDAVAMQRHYRKHFGRDSTMIAYGADVAPSSRPELIAPFGVTPRGYYLIVSRLVPENSLEIMLEGFHRSTTTRSLLVVGGANYKDAFHGRLRALADSDARIRLVGQLHDQAALAELWCNSFAYLHGHSVGGTNPALLRAMGHGCCVVARDTVFNREVLAGTGRFFDATPESVTAGIDAIDGDPEGAAALGVRAAARVGERYTWDGVTDAYERLFQRVVSAAHPATERGASRSMG